uniref:Uncharacterized protein n=1 Tax=Coprothermobacter proteolyticus (strain ATCC 35245 / DSM 5265 / OCM 4 / BT) TaxID=309798 RepID=B5Y5Y2_COPPD
MEAGKPFKKARIRNRFGAEGGILPEEVAGFAFA